MHNLAEVADDLANLGEQDAQGFELDRLTAHTVGVFGVYRRAECCSRQSVRGSFGCAKAVAPAQMLVDIATLPLAIIKPERMVHIDAEEILQ